MAEHGLPADLFARGELEPSMTERDLPRLHALVADRRRVWVVGPDPAALPVTLDLRQRWTFPGV